MHGRALDVSRPARDIDSTRAPAYTSAVTTEAPTPMPSETLTVRCPSCGAGFPAAVTAIVDAADPAARRALLGGQLNLVTCPSCGAVTRVTVPLLYHDASKDAAHVFVPEALGLGRDEQEREIGRLTNRVLDSLPQAARRMYLLQPRLFVTERSFHDAVLEASGVSRESIDRARAHAALVERLLAAPDPAAMDALLAAEGTAVDAELVALVQGLAEQAAAAGDTARVGRLVALRDALAPQVEGLTLTLDELIDELAAAREAGELEPAVAMLRSVLDYAFFAALTERIDAAEPAGAEALRALRAALLEATDAVDANARAEIEAAVRLLRAALAAPDPRAFLGPRAGEIASTFFLVLEANLAAAEEGGQDDLVAALGAVGDAAAEAYEASLPALARLVSRLARAEADERDTLLDGAPDLVGPELVAALDQAAAEARAGGAEPVARALEAARASVAVRLGAVARP